MTTCKPEPPVVFTSGATPTAANSVARRERDARQRRERAAVDRIEVEQDEVRHVERRFARVPHVQHDRREVGDVRERRFVVADDELDRVVPLARRRHHRRYPLRQAARDVLLPKRRARRCRSDSVRASAAGPARAATATAPPRDSTRSDRPWCNRRAATALCRGWSPAANVYRRSAATSSSDAAVMPDADLAARARA